MPTGRPDRANAWMGSTSSELRRFCIAVPKCPTPGMMRCVSSANRLASVQDAFYAGKLDTARSRLDKQIKLALLDESR